MNRNWAKIITGVGEATVQITLLGPTGYSNAISALFKAFEGGRTNSSADSRATELVVEALAYCTVATLFHTEKEREPTKNESKKIVSDIIERAKLLIKQNDFELTRGDVEAAASSILFKDASQHFHHLLVASSLKPQQNAKTVAAIFSKEANKAFVKIRARAPEYYSAVINALVGPDAEADERVQSWENYSTQLIRRFEDEPLFGQTGKNQITLGQVFLPLRAWFDVEIDNLDADDKTDTISDPNLNVDRNICWLSDNIGNWLKSSDQGDPIRLISGGPGSGKSTYAKSLAAEMSDDPAWRVLFVPLQRLDAGGILGDRINRYFTSHDIEPLDENNPPISSSRNYDGHNDWLFIFDGLDELAREGSKSESIAKEFAYDLLGWKAKLSSALNIKILVLGRAPSMQDAMIPLSLRGERVLHVSDMLPISKNRNLHSFRTTVRNIVDPRGLAGIDQRSSFWRRWSAAKSVATKLPKAFTEERLEDLTKEPLLAYLLILSGYVDDKWQAAAENRNVIYREIFAQIWEREKSKPTRVKLREIGKDGFDGQMQALGLATWSGGGRTGDEATFKIVCEKYVRPDIYLKMKENKLDDLDNVALLFYTQKDVKFGRGYEFMHKSFGEYLTACALLDAFVRWSNQVIDEKAEFTVHDFIRKWLKITGDQIITREIKQFLHAQIRLELEKNGRTKTWRWARPFCSFLTSVIDTIIKEGFPASSGSSSWRLSESRQANAELSLWLLLAGFNSVAYPSELKNVAARDDGWTAGPIKIPSLLNEAGNILQLINRLEIICNIGYQVSMSGRGNNTSGRFISEAHEIFKYLNFENIGTMYLDLSLFDLSHTNFDHASIVGGRFYNCKFIGASLRHATFDCCNVSFCDFKGADLSGSEWKHSDFTHSKMSDANMKNMEVSMSTESPIKTRKKRAKKA